MARGMGRDVVMTMVGGRVLYRNGRFAEADMEEARRAAEKTAVESRFDAKTRYAANELAEALRRHYGSAEA